jgi:predicted dehydrogenase
MSSAAAIAATTTLGRTKRVSAIEKLNIAAIGAGGKGQADTHGCRSENIVALCDVDWDRAANTFERFPNATKYRDFREMLDKQKDIDAVTISTPDHTHAVAAMACMQLGKHVYVQKPLTYTIAEARMLTQAAREHKVATQMGNQGHSGNGVRDLCEMIWSGAIGQVKECHIWTNRPVWPQGINRPADSPPVPENMAWDLWLGPAPERPYHPAYAPFSWRGWWDFGCGALGDMACHIADPANWALRLSEVGPLSVECIQQEGVTEETFPNKSIIRYQFPQRGDQDPVTVYWYDGGNKPQLPADIPAGTKLGDGDNGSLFIGAEGYVTAGEYGGQARLVPDDKMAGYTKPDQIIPRIPNEDPYINWIQACKGGTAACSNFDYAGPFTEWVVMGNLSLRYPGQKLDWNAEKMKVTNVKEANEFVARKPRKGWSYGV